MSTPNKYPLGLMAVGVLLTELLLAVIVLGSWWLLVREVPAFRLERPWVLVGPGRWPGAGAHLPA
jgi:hypothetical protein